MSAVVGIAMAAAIGVLAAAATFRLSPLLLGSNPVNVSFCPNRLRTSEVVITLLAVIVKTLLGKLSRVAGDSTKPKEIPRRHLVLCAPFKIGKSDVNLYRAAAGSRDDNGPTIEPHHLLLFLSAVSEPAMLLLLASPLCPINAIGAVNVRNKLELLRPDLLDLENLSSDIQAGLTATIRDDVRQVRRGIEYDLEVTVHVSGHEESGGVTPIFRQVFTMLELLDIKNGPGEVPSKPDDSAAWLQQVSPEDTVQIKFSPREPFKWAALCKDYNLIHVSTLAAKAFGFRGTLAHGNHVVAKAVTKLRVEGRLTVAKDGAPSWMEVHFRRPVILPSALEVEPPRQDQETGGMKFRIYHKSKVAVGVAFGQW